MPKMSYRKAKRFCVGHFAPRLCNIGGFLLDGSHLSKSGGAEHGAASVIAAPSAADLAWAAGFVDGEGCIHIVRQRYKGQSRADSYNLAVHIGQNHRQTLQDFCIAVGIPAVIHPLRKTQKLRRQMFSLNFSGRKALELLARIEPHLRRKRREAQAAMEFWTAGGMGVRRGRVPLPRELIATRERYWQLLKDLK